MDSETVKAKLPEMAEKGGEDALLPLVLLRVLEDGEAHRAELKAAKNSMAESQKTLGALKKATEQLASAQKEENSKNKNRLEKIQSSLSEHIRHFAGIAKKGGWGLWGLWGLVVAAAAAVIAAVLALS